VKAPALAIVFGTLICLSSTKLVLAADDNQKSPPQSDLLSIQQQIDTLNKNQQLILQELGEIRKLLQGKPAKVEGATNQLAPKIISLNVHGEPFKGDSRARVAIMEYSDFDCSFCAKYVSEILPKIDEQYIKTGKIKYFFRDLPEPAQTNSWIKASAARCAGEQGKFWEMHDLLFAGQSAPTAQDPASYAQALGLDVAKFGECLSSGRYSDSVRRSVAGAGRMGVFGTPAFLIGTLSEDGDFMKTTKVFLGAESYEEFKSILDELLTPPTPPPAR